MQQEPDRTQQHGLSTHPEPDGAGASQGLTPSTASNASFETGAGDATTGFDSPAETSSYLSNADGVAQSEQGEPYYPPGGGPERERSRNTTEDKQ